MTSSDAPHLPAQMFDSSVVRGESITFGLNQARRMMCLRVRALDMRLTRCCARYFCAPPRSFPAGLRVRGASHPHQAAALCISADAAPTGLQLMTPGETRRLWIPEALAYRGMAGRPKGMLVFDVSLYSVKSTPQPPKAPADVAAVPADAQVTPSGLASKLLQAGSGAKPKATDRVTVNYSGWTLKGELFDSSIPRGEPATFPLNRVIAGWTEGAAPSHKQSATKQLAPMCRLF
jgi:hypothetical protein